jgi:hypothetical protein
MLRAFLERFRPPTLTPQRIRAAYAVAITVDVIQIALGPLGWFFADEILDVIASVLVWRLIGFHPLLLPTFVLEVVPVIDMLPTWTGCVAIVVNIRKRQQAGPPPLASGRIIDI